jgi:hypothetical protein
MDYGLSNGSCQATKGKNEFAMEHKDSLLNKGPSIRDLYTHCCIFY